MTDNLPAQQPRPKAALVSFSDMSRLAKTVYDSRLFKGLDNVNQAFTLMMLCQSDGIDPIQAMRRYDIIKGRPALKAGSMLADFKKIGGIYKVITRTDVACKINFKQGGIEIDSEWTIEDAKKAGLLGKDNWKHYARAMLFARAVSEGIRIVSPEINLGIYTPEEVMDYENFDDGSKATAEEKKKYDLVMQIIGTDIDAISDAETANEFVLGINSYEHIGDSKARAGQAIFEKAFRLELIFDKESKTYSDPAVIEEAEVIEPDGKPPTDGAGAADPPAEEPAAADPVSQAEPDAKSEPDAEKTRPEDEEPVTTRVKLQARFKRLCGLCSKNPTKENMAKIDSFWEENKSIRTEKNQETILVLQSEIAAAIDKGAAK